MTTTEDLEARLAAAEQVCVLVGWTGVHGGERGDALGQAWQDWNHAYPEVDAKARSSGKEWDARIRELAARRTEIRSATLRRLAGEPEPDSASPAAVPVSLQPESETAS